MYQTNNGFSFGGYQQPNYQQQSFQQPSYTVRPVTSKEEVLAAQIDFMGPGGLFPDMGHGVVYLKRFEPNLGQTKIYTFAISEENDDRNVTVKDLEELKKTIFEELKKIMPSQTGFSEAE